MSCAWMSEPEDSPDLRREEQLVVEEVIAAACGDEHRDLVRVEIFVSEEDAKCMISSFGKSRKRVDSTFGCTNGSAPFLIVRISALPTADVVVVGAKAHCFLESVIIVPKSLFSRYFPAHALENWIVVFFPEDAQTSSAAMLFGGFSLIDNVQELGGFEEIVHSLHNTGHWLHLVTLSC